MKKANFNTYKKEFREIIRQVLAESERGRLDEAGFPAYSHANPLINWLFWQRVGVVMEFLQQKAPYHQVLDFGCGSGILLPFLCRISKRVTAIDIDLLPFELVSRHLEFPANLQALDGNKITLADLPTASFDLIVALDVLEHVDDLPEVLSGLRAVLKPGGQLVVSGPTENMFYKLGRKLAGPEYSGDYHERGIDEVRKGLEMQMQVTSIASLYWPVPLFEIFVGQA